MNFLFFLFCLSLFIFLCSLLFRRFIIRSIRKYLKESYGTSNFTFKYGIHTISIDYLCGHGPDSEVKIISLEIVFDIFGYLFKKLPFLRCRVGKISFELNSNNLSNSDSSKNQFFDYSLSGDDLEEVIKARQRIKYQKQNPQKLRIHHIFDQNQDQSNNQPENQNQPNDNLIQNDKINQQQQQQQNFDQNQQQNGYYQDTIKTNQNPLERWIARRLLGFFLAILVKSAQVDTGSFTLKIGSFSLNIKDISIFYNRSATSIISHIHFNEISVTSDKKLQFKYTAKDNKEDDQENNNENDKENISNLTSDDNEVTALLRIPDISMTITSDTQSFKYFLGGMLSQFRINIDEINIDYSDGQMSVSSIQSQMHVLNDLSCQSHVNVSQIFVVFPIIDFYTKTLSATINDISLSLESGKFVSGPILITRNEQPFFNSHSMKYRKGKIDFEYLDVTISTPFLVDLSLFKRCFSAFNEEIINDIKRLTRSSYSRFDNNDSSEQNLRSIISANDSTSSVIFSSNESINEKSNKDESSSINNSSEILSGFDDQSSIQQEIEIDIEKYDQKQNEDEDEDDSEDESRKEFESAYDLIDDSWTQGSDSSSNYKFSVEKESVMNSKSIFGSFRRRKKNPNIKKIENSFIINSPTAILRFTLSDNHILTYNIRQFAYSNYFITAKSFTLDASFTDSQHLSSSLEEELRLYNKNELFENNNNSKNIDQQLIHRFCECHHASFNFITPTISFKCNTGNFFLTNEFAEGSFIQEFLALFRFLHNQTKIKENENNLNTLSDESRPNNNNDNDNDIKEDKENKEDENPLTKYCFSCDIHKFGIEMKNNSLVSKIHRSNEAKRLAIEGLQIRQEKAIQIMNANLSNDPNSNTSFSLNDFEQTSRKMLFDLYKSAISNVQCPKDDDLFYAHSKDFHLSFDGPKISNRKQGIEELKRSVRFIKKKKDPFDKIKKRSKITDFDEKYDNYIQNNTNEEIENAAETLIDVENEKSQKDVFDTKNLEFDEDEFNEVVSKIGTFDCGALCLSASMFNVSTPRIGTLMTFKNIKSNGTMLIMKQKATKNDDLYHFPIHCDKKSIEFIIPRISHRTITVFNIYDSLCNEAYFKYTTALKELQEDFFFGTSLFRKNKFSFKRLEFFDNMRLRYRLKLNMNVNSLDVDFNTRRDAYSQYPLFKVQLPNFKVVCDDNETFQFSSDNIYLKILNSLQFDYSFLLTLPNPSMKLKFISYNSNYDTVLKNILDRIKKKRSKSESKNESKSESKSDSKSESKSDSKSESKSDSKSESKSESKSKSKSKSRSKSDKYNYNKDELLLLKCRCKKRPFFIPIHGSRMDDSKYDPYKLFRSHSFSIHFILNFDKSQNASINLDYLQPVINAFLAKKSLLSTFVAPSCFSNRHLCPKLSFVDFVINLPGILITMNRNKILSKMNGDSITLKFNNRKKQVRASVDQNDNDQKQEQNAKIDENESKKSFSLDIDGKNMKFNATMDERILYESQISTINVNYEKGYSVGINIGTINCNFSPLIINFLAYPPIVKIQTNNSTKSTKQTTSSKATTALPLLSLQNNSNNDTNKSKANSSQQNQNNEETTSSSYFPFAFPKYENRTELPTFYRDDQFQGLFRERTIVVKIDSAVATLHLNNNKTIESKAGNIRFEQRIIPKDDEIAMKHRKSNMIDFDFNLCPPLQSIQAESLSITTARNNINLLFLENPYFAFSKASNLTYYHIVGATLTICPSEDDFSFFIPTAKAFFKDLYAIHKERQRNELREQQNKQQKIGAIINEKDEKDQIPLRAVISSSYLKQIVVRLVGNDLTTLGTLTADDIIIQIRRSQELLEIGQFLIRKLTAINELGNDAFKNVIESSKEPFLTLKYDKPPISMKNSFIQSIIIMINPFKLRIDTSYFKRLNAEFPSASLLKVFILEGPNAEEVKNDEYSIENFESSNEIDLLNSRKSNRTMSHSNSSHFNSIGGFDTDIEVSRANYDDQIDQVKKKKKNKEKSRTASESDAESRKSEKKRQKKEKKERKKESKKLAKESLSNRALRLKNPFFCQHFKFYELPIEVSFRSFDDNNSPYLVVSNSSLSLSSQSISNSKDSQSTLMPTNLIVDRNMQIGNLEIVDFYGDYKMLFKDISWHLKSSYFRSLSSLLLKKKKNSVMSTPPKPDS